MPSSRARTWLVVALVALTAVASLGTAAATSAPPEGRTSTGAASAAPDATIEDGGVYWVGQTLVDDRWRVDAVELQHREDGEWVFVADVPVEDDHVRVHTAGAEAGRYRLVADGSARTVSFRLRAQTLDVTLDASTVRNTGEQGATTTNVSLRSNRGGYDLAVTSADLDGSTLRRVLGRGESVDTDSDATSDAVVLSGVSSTAELTANFSRVTAGNATLAFTPVDATASANATVTVESVPIVDAWFPRTVNPASDAGVVRVPVELDGRTDRATVVVGSEDEPVSFVATLADSDGDGRAVLAWNATANQTADAALAAGNGTTLVDATRRRPDGDVGDVDVDGEYTLSLYAGNGTAASEVDVAVAVTDANQSDSPAIELGHVDAPDIVDVGDEFQAAVAVENTGGVDVTTTVRVVHDGENVTTESLDVAAGATETVIVPLSAEAVGTARYRFVAADASTTFAVEVVDGTELGTTTSSTTTPTSAAGTTTTATRTGTGTTDDGTAGASDDANGMPGFGLAVAVVALAAVALLARTRD
ncbi:PGF-CTERM sorting domain-containing protein [Halorubellus salinus]|uniref:PGF-CTERM sorting domain-containing protein n=1 Tax=Halorubellus salinus TaxID=755309 RepID=UPI001D08261F|nr:PGF-CTERM sorting domain-containing protein [Halorubellus salinus]